MLIKNKRFKDIFDQYVHKGEATPLSIGSLVVCGFCFLFFLIATFTQFDFSHPFIQYTKEGGFSIYNKEVAYNPLIPAMIFIIYILGRNYSYFLFACYLLTGFFIWPIFAFGGGFSYIQNYLFGYILGFIFAIIISGKMYECTLNVKARLLGALLGVFAIHLCGFIYCIILALFKIIDFSLIFPIVQVMSVNKMGYDIIFASLIILIAPYIKNIFWICMKPKYDNKKKRLKNSRKRNKIISNDIYQHGQNYD